MNYELGIRNWQPINNVQFTITTNPKNQEPRTKNQEPRTKNQ
ncbi:MAG: hypothetical protein AMXMBFR48_19170, partial [Ignavibacteriales bacterium]